MPFEATEAFRKLDKPALISDRDMLHASMAGELAYAMAGTERAAGLAMLIHASSQADSEAKISAMRDLLFVSDHEAFANEAAADAFMNDAEGSVIDYRTIWRPETYGAMVAKWPNMDEDQRAALLAHTAVILYRFNDPDSAPAPDYIIDGSYKTAKAILDMDTGNEKLRGHIQALMPTPGRPDAQANFEARMALVMAASPGLFPGA